MVVTLHTNIYRKQFILHLKTIISSPACISYLLVQVYSCLCCIPYQVQCYMSSVCVHVDTSQTNHNNSQLCDQTKTYLRQLLVQFVPDIIISLSDSASYQLDEAEVIRIIRVCFVVVLANKSSLLHYTTMCKILKLMLKIG